MSDKKSSDPKRMPDTSVNSEQQKAKEEPKAVIPQPTHFEVSLQDTNELAKVITETVTSPYVKELLFIVINRTFKPVMPLVKK